MDQNHNEDRRQAPTGGEQGGQHKKPFHGKHRPHHKKGHDRRQGNRNNQQVEEALAIVNADNEAAKETSGQQSQNQKKKSRQPQGDRKAAPTPPPEDNNKKGNRPRPQPGRPSRGTSMPKRPQELPQMDNLLIDDCPEEVDVLAHGDVSSDEIDRILSRDIFESPHTDIIPDEIPEGKAVVAGIRFRAGGKTYFFDPGKVTCTAGKYAIVETARGLEFGEVCIPNRMVDVSLIVPPLRPVIRMATKADIEQHLANREKEEEATRIGREKIAEHKLDMKLVSVQYTFDCSKLLFYFTSEGRVDFRELVKDLAGVFRIRIELRQIGIRDEARMLGGLGACGRPLCCSTFLSDFGQVSMKMAKDQGLALNSTKISGCCGRLMCCLRYEHETYLSLTRELPAQGTVVNTPDGLGTVVDVYPLEGQVKVALRGNGSENPPAPKKYKKCQISTDRRPAREDISDAPTEVTEPDSAD